MKTLNKMSEDHFLALFFTCFSLSFLLAAFFMPDRADMLPGLWRILNSPTKSATNFFDIGGYSATFLNMGLVALIMAALFHVTKTKVNNVSTLAVLLTVGFGSWGINVLNIWPTILGVALHCLVKDEKLGSRTNAMLFTTGLAPFMSELMVRYPNPEVVGLHPTGVALALIIGVTVGYFMPAGLDNSPKIHKGFALYSAALPVGMTAFLLQSVLYKAMGIEIPGAISELHVGDPAIVLGFCITLFSSFVIAALLMGCTWRDYWRLLTDPEPVVNFSAAYGNGPMLMNVGAYGLYILLYYNLIGAEFNGVTFGVIFCMLSTCNSGSHPINAIPILLGYGVASQFFQALMPFSGGDFTHFLHSQSLIVGICYANGLSPIAHEYGWRYGILVAALHFCMVTTTPQLHGGMCLYNGGFTAALVCLLILPGMEKHFRTKHERRSSYQRPQLKVTSKKH